MMIKSMRRAFWRTALAGAIGLAASQANAYFLYPGEPTVFEDNDIEMLVNATGSPNNTLLEVGDKLRGVLSIDGLLVDSGNFPSQELMGGFANALGTEEITGIFEIEVVAAVQNPNGTWNFQFGPSASFTNVYGPNSVIALFNQNAGDLVIVTAPTSCDKTSVATCETAATNGDLLWTFGFGDADAQWDAVNVASNDVSFIAAQGGGTILGGYNFALGLLTTVNGEALAPQAMSCLIFACAGDAQIELIGSGTVNGGLGLQSGYDGRSDFQFSVLQAVPEPGSLALTGLALAALGGLGARRKKA